MTARRRGAVLAVLGLARADARRRRAGRELTASACTRTSPRTTTTSTTRRERFGCTPAEYAESLGWTGGHVWHAHCVKLDAPGIALFASTAHGRRALSDVQHAPGVGHRAGARDARSPACRWASASTAAASNDGAHLLAEARQAMLLQRVASGAAALSRARGAGDRDARRRRACSAATISATLAPGMAADVVAFDLDTPGFAGAAEHDPLAALVLCAPAHAALAVIDGRVVVRDGRLATLDLPRVLGRQRAMAMRLARPD